MRPEPRRRPCSTNKNIQMGGKAGASTDPRGDRSALWHRKSARCRGDGLGHDGAGYAGYNVRLRQPSLVGLPHAGVLGAGHRWGDAVYRLADSTRIGCNRQFRSGPWRAPEILQECYAKGEITREQYEQVRHDLEDRELGWPRQAVRMQLHRCPLLKVLFGRAARHRQQEAQD